MLWGVACAPDTIGPMSTRLEGVIGLEFPPAAATAEWSVHEASQAVTRSQRYLFVSALATSAFLLFTLELLAGREVLPIFGGAPGVWATALCFFTGVLFVGYGYAHFVATRLGRERGQLVHLVLAIGLVAATAVAPHALSGMRMPGLPEALNVLLALFLVAGPAAFLLASTTPLLSSWFAGTSTDAWWLYAASNAASLAGLLLYPFVIEPALPLSAQRTGLGAGLILFVGLLACIVATGRRKRGASASATAAGVPDDSTASASMPITRRRRFWWLVAAFVPAGLLTATTGFLTTDLVSAPLIWIGPLAIYLASFVVAFSARGRRFLPAVNRLVPAAATLLWLPYVAPVGWPVVPLVITVLGSFAVLAVAIHGRLAEDRPDAAHLTHFYLVLSAAGVLATAVVGVLAPLILTDIYEYPLLVVAGPAVLAIRATSGTTLRLSLDGATAAAQALVARVAPYALVGGLLVAFAGRADPGLIGLLAVGGLVVIGGVTPRILAITTPAALVIALLALTGTSGTSLLMEGRSFFGVSKVVDTGDAIALYSGTTLHGLQFTDQRAAEPATYYVSDGPLGDVFADLRGRVPENAAVGVVGLGGGTIAAYGQAGDRLTFFEIDPLVVAVASDPRYFTYLSDTRATTTTILGDGRLSLAAQPQAAFDVLVLDAFSSDSVPPHLLTSEAIASYMRTLRPNGVLVFNLSNRYYDLVTAVAATAGRLGLAAVARQYSPDEATAARSGATRSVWLVVAPAQTAERFVARGWLALGTNGPVLTDDYPDITRVLRWQP